EKRRARGQARRTRCVASAPPHRLQARTGDVVSRFARPASSRLRTRPCPTVSPRVVSRRILSRRLAAYRAAFARYNRGLTATPFPP
ncbi:hypothetical protein GR157_36785, partial [Burkholderia sp. 4701]|nr:hypothetical protein [Burkholderia sp. 4701]